MKSVFFLSIMLFVFFHENQAIDQVDDLDPAMSAHFWNKENYDVDMYWEDHKGGVFQGIIRRGSRIDINTYVGHRFFFTPKGRKEERITDVLCEKSKTNYFLYDEKTRKAHKERKIEEERKFKAEYKKENGIPWIHYYPREKPQHYMYPAEFQGQSWDIETKHTKLVKCEESESSDDKNENAIISEGVCSADDGSCQEETHTSKKKEPKLCKEEKETFDIKIELICDSPRAYKISNFLSDFECDEIIRSGFEIGFNRSTVADTAEIDPTRSSETVWIKRVDSDVVDYVSKRIADAVQINERLLDMDRSAESLQLVKYSKDQYYNYHVDYGTDRANSRYITFLMYLNTPEEGGETDFRSAKCWGERKSLSIKAEKGSAMFFYNLLPDGNADKNTIHSGTHVRKGMKFMTNLWIWDPVFT